ncbi:MAG: LCP family protein [Synergistaceae bacterium]|nr:LCP family protein [Synergistaceae bacterium]
MKFLKIFVIVFLILTATVGGATWRIVEEFDRFRTSPVPTGGDVESSDAFPESSLKIDSALGTVNILLVGLDDVDGGHRADAIAVACFDMDVRSIRVISLPRDSRVFIPGRNWDKINHAYVYGGISLLKETVMNLLNVGINYYTVINYDSFPRIIDLLGGIDIDVEKKLVYTDYSGKLFINIPKGRQHMQGKTVLEYVRFRHDPLGDIGRVQRQQQVISLLMAKLKSPSIITKIPALVSEALAAVNTDLSPRDVISLLAFANSLPSERIKLVMAPGKSSYIGDLSYWILDIPKLTPFLVADPNEEKEEFSDTSFKSFDGVSDSNNFSDEFPDAMAAMPSSFGQETLLDLLNRISKIGILNGDGEKGLGRRASQIFQKLGIDVAYTGNARHFDYYTSNIVYPENATESDREAAEALARLCGITLIQKNRTVSMVSVILGHDKENIFKRLEGVYF